MRNQKKKERKKIFRKNVNMILKDSLSKSNYAVLKIESNYTKKEEKEGRGFGRMPSSFCFLPFLLVSHKH